MRECEGRLIMIKFGLFMCICSSNIILSDETKWF